jgi:hypothetical protein
MDPFPGNNQKYNVQFLDRSLYGPSNSYFIKALKFLNPKLASFPNRKTSSILTTLSRSSDKREISTKTMKLDKAYSGKHG